MTYSTEYFWVVLCKNKRFHKHQNLFFGHPIPLAETDAIDSPPPLNERFRVRCNDCGEEYTYEPKEVLRSEIQPPDAFTPHPLFC